MSDWYCGTVRIFRLKQFEEQREREFQEALDRKEVVHSYSTSSHTHIHTYTHNHIHIHNHTHAHGVVSYYNRNNLFGIVVL